MAAQQVFLPGGEGEAVLLIHGRVQQIHASTEPVVSNHRFPAENVERDLVVRRHGHTSQGPCHAEVKSSRHRLAGHAATAQLEITYPLSDMGVGLQYGNCNASMSTMRRYRLAEVGEGQ
ncbi:hypothetical protein [Streptomyces platensis]|uniref:hypothetical protein n=1 Tax=Streptomyces platensis TaxID=58346 RepID=UPI001180C918